MARGLLSITRLFLVGFWPFALPDPEVQGRYLILPVFLKAAASLQLLACGYQTTLCHALVQLTISKEYLNDS